LHILPSQYLELDDNEKAFIIASIEIRNEAEKKKQKDIERKNKRR